MCDKTPGRDVNHVPPNKKGQTSCYLGRMSRFWSFLVCLTATAGGPFLAKPYLQLGNDAGALTLMWHAESGMGEWKVEWNSQSAKPVMRAINTGKRHFVYQTSLTGLKPGETFQYRVLLDGTQVFDAQAHAPAAAGQPYKFAVFGDCGAGTSGQKQVAVEVYKFKPDLVFIPGDIVYWFGLSNEYQSKFFPIFNADDAGVKTGAPLMRSTIFTASVGNHDVAGRNLGLHPGGLAYFYYWSLPLNGLPTFTRPGLKGSSTQLQAFKDVTGDAFPRMSNYSFTYGNSYWLVLDSDSDIDWSQPELAQWVQGELASPVAQQAQWRFVGFHHPGFSSSHAHAGDQQMRVLSKTFEDAKVDVIFSGHVHNYQRTRPLKFKLESYDASKSHKAPGEWTLDRKFDGKSQTKPEGIIYLITGAGGALLYDKGQGGDPKSWQDFTVQFVADVHSFTAVEVDGATASFRQLDDHGRVVDSFTITK